MFQSQPTEEAKASPARVIPENPEAAASTGWGFPFGVGLGTALGVGPLALWAGVWVGAGSLNTVRAALPALLLVLALPPLAVAVMEAWASRRQGLGPVRTGRALGLAFGTQVGILGGAIGVHASARRLGDAALLVLVQAVLLPGVVTWALKARRRAGTLAAKASGVSLLVLLGLADRAEAGCPERDAWPTKDWSPGVLAAGHEPALRAFEQYAFTRQEPAQERKGVRTDGVVIIHRGRLVYERYAPGWQAGRRHLGWSMSKSVTNALTGMAVARGALALEDSICKYVKSSRESACAIQVRHLLEFASGLDWQEGYEDGPLQSSSVLAMLYGEGHADMVSFITSHVQRDVPGTSWEYSSGDTTLLAAVVGAAMRPQQAEGWEWKLLFEPVGVHSAVWERDGKGALVGSSLLYATPRDWAKLGFLFLNEGCWEGQRLVPEGWVAQSTAVAEPLRKKRLYWDAGDVQGWQFWLNRPVPGVQEKRPWPHVPEDAYAMRGHWGQSVTLIPSLDVVVVRMADDREPGAFDLDAFLSKALALVGETP
ncbi:serine hydrolase [Stigmatella sp. ncwal1]|uniref:Serine hydrolase n=1 Tax=Stigmatella ashevillensis TaxID=2995309 RepID=A0ABT5DHP0_9BACT|nr:serine hydrolase [Stigmatella ashevillena]MDC0712278.1 serine hydrolase [Stigmatella ashevillena]